MQLLSPAGPIIAQEICFHNFFSIIRKICIRYRNVTSQISQIKRKLGCSDFNRYCLTIESMFFFFLRMQKRRVKKREERLEYKTIDLTKFFNSTKTDVLPETDKVLLDV